MMSSREVERLLREGGFELKRQKGSHMRFVHADGRKVTLPAGKKDMPLGTLKSIEVQSGLRIVPEK